MNGKPWDGGLANLALVGIAKELGTLPGLAIEIWLVEWDMIFLLWELR